MGWGEKKAAFALAQLLGSVFYQHGLGIKFKWKLRIVSERYSVPAGLCSLP